ncbi:hypothetical protein [Desulfosporosinus sp.]|uniref:hypothetical protein n=1 Tax=Desulfosporosinus sp. TaxID=157907 RepID=UPI0025BBAEE7|nr:hypothetical protein [Desulfosporosinus sp.]MBC2725415.1 hypothetical protein [Desulfosporosinus sp.]
MEHSPERVVLMEGISSVEHFLLIDDIPRRVLGDITLVIRRTETWGINGTSLFEIKLLLEIMANIRPYDEGKCVLIERGMMRRKRVILKHVFYIGSADMLYNNMNVLEFLMFATAQFKTNKVELQEEIFELIITVGLGHLSLTPNHSLTNEEKAVIILIAAAYSDSLIIVFNLPEYKWDKILIEAISKIADFIRERGKTLILSTQESLLIEKACSHTAVIHQGSLIYSGTVENFRLKFDKVEVVIRDKSVHSIKEKLSILLPGYKLDIEDDNLMISSIGLKVSDPSSIFRIILESGFTPESIEINPKTVQNAYEEIMRQHDL